MLGVVLATLRAPSPHAARLDDEGASFVPLTPNASSRHVFRLSRAGKVAPACSVSVVSFFAELRSTKTFTPGSGAGSTRAGGSDCMNASQSGSSRSRTDSRSCTSDLTGLRRRRQTHPTSSRSKAPPPPPAAMMISVDEPSSAGGMLFGAAVGAAVGAKVGANATTDALASIAVTCTSSSADALAGVASRVLKALAP